MIKFKNSKIRVRCLDCKEENYIEMKHIGTENEQRSIGVEYEYYYRGKSHCTHCGEILNLVTTIYEYPVGFFNYIDIVNQTCLVMDTITEEHLIILKENL